MVHLGPPPFMGPDGYLVIPVRPDPRISTDRPAWLRGDLGWCEHLDAMSLADCEWLAGQWEMGGRPLGRRRPSWRRRLSWPV